MDTLVQELVDLLNPDLREEWDERAAIMNWDGGLAQEHAECLALLDLLRRHPCVLAGVAVVEVEFDDGRTWFVTTDRKGAHRVASQCGSAARFVTLSDIVSGHFGGAAVLGEVPCSRPSVERQ